MRKITLLFLFAFHSLISQTWTQITDFPSAGRDDGAAFVIGNKAYCITGRNPSGCTASGYQFDGATETWSLMASLPVGKERQYATPFSYNGKGYLLAGVTCSNTYIKEFWEYNPANDIWTALPDFPGVGRHGAHNFALGDKVYVIGGWDDSNYLNEVWEYNFTTSVWTQKNNLPISGFWRGAAFAIAGRGYIAYGYTNSNHYNHKIYEYQQGSDSWTAVPNVTTAARKYTGTAVINNKAFMFGGEDSLGTFLNDAAVFNPSTGSLSLQSGIPDAARRGGMAFALNDIYYYTCGLLQNGQRSSQTWKTDGVVGINELSVESLEVGVYPNPANELLTISGEYSFEKSDIIIMNSLGQKINVEVKASGENATLNTKGLPEGIYFVLLKTKHGAASERFIVIH